MKTPAAALLLAMSACTLSPRSNDDAVSLAAAETAFAAHSVREDMRAAFLAHFAPDGVTVRNGWIVSNDYLRDRPAPQIVLDWRPVFTESSAAGDLGLSTGPVKITSKAKPDAPPTYAQYVSIWRRAPGEPWRVEVDLGIGHAGPALWDRPLEAVMAPGMGTLSTPRSSLTEAEARFARDSRERGARAAYIAHGTEALRYYRNDQGPIVGRGPAAASPAMTDAKLAWTADRVEASRSNDFGYTRGSFASADAPGVTLGWYLRAWHVEGGEWRIVLDVVNPAASS